ncbi:PREDICTED: protein SLOW GREEN 1, chloroplastic-like [Ipomoea nil]|uniref:protein SLOW GREEN 1, chloroplastic-like n=1 Tax=Ipomoea nil TaxID=35883 RepID=UPI000900E99B|nr:PREDICTED: protein SLOW GREEN 1, chloroplastic-like [Ipomoea nil]
MDYRESSGAPVSAPAAVETAFSDEDKERVLEENLLLNPNDVGALMSLMEMKIQSRKIAEAIGIIDRLMEIDQSDTEWLLLKSHLYAYSGEVETAKNGFNEILAKDPFRVEAYHGLVMAASESKSTQDLKEIEKRIEEGMMKLCKKQGKKAEFRDFKLLEAQIRAIEGKHDEALKVYQELVKEEPRDFRPYICQGIIYTLLRKNNEAEKNFEKFRRLVPKGHPYATYFDETMIATKVFAQKMENEIAMSKK